jgi:monoterpene epsilon-lactone hydrolase
MDVKMNHIVGGSIMPSEQFLEYIKQNPPGMPLPDMKTESGKCKVPVMPEGFKAVMPPIPTGCIGEEVVINGIKGIRISARNVIKGKVFLYIHGGGYTIGSAVDNVPFLVHIVKNLKIECYSIEYSLAPTYKFPTQINEILKFYKGLLEMGYKKIAIGGESAGGTMSIAITHCIKDQNYSLPAAVISLSPRADMSITREFYKRDFLSEMRPEIAEAYAGNTDLKNPYISPIYGNFKGYPPLFIQAGGAESLASEAVYLTEAAAKDDVEVSLHIWKDMGHAFALQFGHYPEADSAMREILDFIKDKIR